MATDHARVVHAPGQRWRSGPSAWCSSTGAQRSAGALSSVVARRALCEMISFAAERLMELEVSAPAGAAYSEKNPERLAYESLWRNRSVDRACFPYASQSGFLGSMTKPDQQLSN